MSSFTKKIKTCLRLIIFKCIPELKVLTNDLEWSIIRSWQRNNEIGENVKIYKPSHIFQSKIGDYTYIAMGHYITMTEIGKFCSIGPNLRCGLGIHPVNGISTAPMFYSTIRQNGMTLASEDKIQEHKNIKIGNDVFIGANVTILDGVTIGDGAVIGAGAVVSKDIPAYAIAVGCPIQIKGYRFNNNIINKLLKIQWWNFDENRLQDVEHLFFEIERFIEKYENNEQPENLSGKLRTEGYGKGTKR